MTILIILFGTAMLVVAGLYTYYLFREQDLFDKYKRKDMRYDG